MNIKRIAAVAGIAALALTGCSGGTDDAARTPDLAKASEAKGDGACKPGVDLYAHPECVNNPAIEGVDPADEGAPTEDETTAVTVGVAKPYQMPEGTVTIDRMKCGIGTLRDAAITDEGETVDLSPAAGSEFCAIFGSFANTTKRPADGTPTFWGVETKDGAQYAQDETVYGDVEGVPIGGFAETINPGKQMKFASVFEVPEGKRPTMMLTVEPGGVDEEVDGLVRFELPKS